MHDPSDTTIKFIPRCRVARWDDLGVLESIATLKDTKTRSSKTTRLGIGCLAVAKSQTNLPLSVPDGARQEKEGARILHGAERSQSKIGTFGALIFLFSNTPNQ